MKRKVDRLLSLILVLCLALTLSSFVYAEENTPVPRAAIHCEAGGRIFVTREMRYYTQWDMHDIHFDNNVYYGPFDVYTCNICGEVANTNLGGGYLVQVNCLGPWP